MTDFKAKILTLFPDFFPGLLASSLSGKALDKKIWSCETINIRDFATDNYKTVDDDPFGGGAGMILKPDVLDKAITSAVKDQNREDYPLYYLSPRGIPLTQEKVKDIASKKGVTLLCGRYEGVDQRVLDYHQIEEISVGDYILSGGELPAQILLDAVIRLLPGVMGNQETVSEESFESGLLEYHHYTRPAEWKGMKVPEILLSGNHKRIEEFRRKQSEEITKERRPDLIIKKN